MKKIFRISLILFFFGFNISCTHLIYAGAEQRGYFVLPSSIKPSPKVFRIKVTSEQSLEAWQFQAKDLDNFHEQKKPKAVILQLHGNAQNQSSHFASLYWLVKEGFDLVSFDYRGYGFSSAIDVTQASTIEDAKIAMSWVMENYPDVPIIFWGQSLGGAILQRAIQELPTTDRLSVIVYEGSFNSYRDAARSVLKRNWFTLIAYPFVPLLIDDSGKAKRESDLPDQQISNAPKLVIHARHDPVVSYDLGEDLFQSLRGQKYFWSLKSDNHIASFHELGYEARRQKLLNCFELFLRPSSERQSQTDKEQAQAKCNLDDAP